MIARICTVWGDSLHIVTDDPDRARRRGRNLIPIRDKSGQVSGPPEGELSLHVANVADGGGR